MRNYCFPFLRCFQAFLLDKRIENLELVEKEKGKLEEKHAKEISELKEQILDIKKAILMNTARKNEKNFYKDDGKLHVLLEGQEIELNSAFEDMDYGPWRPKKKKFKLK